MAGLFYSYLTSALTRLRLTAQTDIPQGTAGSFSPNDFSADFDI